jgi:uncharacterized protein (DUF58 family)
MAGKPRNGDDARGPASVREALTAEALARLGSMQLRARVLAEGYFSGQHRSPMRGASVEFADHREYAPGDDMRHLDWRLYARSDRDFVKQFDAETNLSVYLLLDVSRSMAYPSAGPTKLDYGAYLAAGLAYIAWKQRDAPGLGLVDNRLRQILPPRTQRGYLARLLDVLDNAEIGEDTDLPAGLSEAAAVVTRRGLVVLISDLWAPPDDVVRTLRYFRRQGHDVVALHTLHPDEIALPFRGSWTFVDPENQARTEADAALTRQAYQAAARAHLEALQDGLRASFIDYQLCDTTRPFDLALSAVLARRRRAG